MTFGNLYIVGFENMLFGASVRCGVYVCKHVFSFSFFSGSMLMYEGENSSKPRYQSSDQSDSCMMITRRVMIKEAYLGRGSLS